MENIETGFLLMVVGMTTVFAILLIVIYLGKGLIVLAISAVTRGQGKVIKIEKV